MNTFLKSMLIFSCLTPLISHPFTINTDDLKSPTAVAIYSAILVSVGSQCANKIFDSSFYKVRKLVNLLTSDERQLEVLFKEKELELEQAKFNLLAAQKQMLEAGYPRYKKNLARKRQAIIESSKSEAEKDAEISEIDKRLTLIKQEKNEKSDSLFEQMIQQASTLR